MNLLIGPLPIAAVVLLLAGCAPMEAAQEELELAQACLVTGQDTVHIEVELARTRDERERGLMERTELDEHRGMLFIYEDLRPPSHSFWMYNTPLPLDIAFIRPDDTIGTIRAMAPCPDTAGRCPSYPADVAFTRALEMNQGFFSRAGVREGDRFLLKGEPGCD